MENQGFFRLDVSEPAGPLKTLYAVGIGPTATPGVTHREVRVLATSERHAFRLAQALLNDDEWIYFTVVVDG